MHTALRLYRRNRAATDAATDLSSHNLLGTQEQFISLRTGSNLHARIASPLATNIGAHLQRAKWKYIANHRRESLGAKTKYATAIQDDSRA